MTFKFCTRFVPIIFLSLALESIASGQSDADIDEQALKEVEKFLKSPEQRQAYSETRPDAKAANNFLEGFPQYAQDEIIEINLMLLRESKGGASKHVQAMQQGGAEAAKNSFSPAVKARMDALVKRLESDPKFNTPENISKLKALMPKVPGA